MAKQSFILPPSRPRDLAICGIVDALQDLPIEHGFRVEVHEHRTTRSDLQNRTLWWIYANILAVGGATMAGWLKEDLHEFFLSRHFGVETKIVFGMEIENPVRRSSRLSKIEFAEFVDGIYSFMASKGVILAQPDRDYALECDEVAA